MSHTSIAPLEPEPYGSHDRHAHKPGQIDVLELLLREETDVLVDHPTHQAPVTSTVGAIA